MDKIIKTLNGHSGSKVYLMQNNFRKYVLKVGNVDRNYERMTSLLTAGYPIPNIYEYVPGERLEMEYIHGLDMKNHLLYNNPVSLCEFIHKVIDSFQKTSINDKDYTDTYYEKLDWLPKDFLFTKEELISTLPKLLPQSLYHGDFTLENIIHTDSGFHLIDPVTVEYDSYIFDIAKLRQDIDCKWFIRNENVYLDAKLQQIKDFVKNSYSDYFLDGLVILMLLRVLKHCEKDDMNYMFLMREVERLWK